MNWGELALTILMGRVACSAVSRADEPQKLAPDVQERCLGILREGMESDEFWPAIHAAEGLTLASHGDEVVVALRDRLPTERDDQRRCGLARELVRAGDRSPLPILLDILSNPESTGRVHAAESLFKLGETGDRKQLRAAFEQAEHPPLQLWAAAALAKTGVGSYPDAYADICDASPVAYHALKGSIVHMTRNLAVYWAPDGVCVNCLSPGPFPGPTASATLVEPLSNERKESV